MSGKVAAVASYDDCYFVLPVLNEEAGIRDTLQALQLFRQRGATVIVVDGGSTDNTVELAQDNCDQLLHSDPGRAIQMNTGAADISQGWLLFLHADTRVENSFLDSLFAAPESAQWGFCRVALSAKGAAFRVIEGFINWRSGLTGIGTGDQLIFVRAALFHQQGGFDAVPLMEDIALCKKLGKFARPYRLAETVITSSRRWERGGVVRTVLLMWWLRFAYWLGVSPARLALWYRAK